MKFQNDYKDVLAKFCDHLKAMESTIQELYNLKDDAVKQVVNEETTVNDLLHFLELENNLHPQVLSRTSTLIGDCRRSRRDAKMVLQDINNLNNVSEIALGSFNDMCKKLNNTISDFKHVFEKELEFKPKKIDFKKLRENQSNVQYS